jgi:hypothetical protein
MSASDNTPYLSRFFLKFIEIIAAGLATAVTGYLIAHLSGGLRSPSPAPTTTVIQVSPSANTVSNLPSEPNTSSASTISNAPSQPIAPNANIPSSPPITGDANAQRLPSQQGVNAPFVPRPQRKTVSTTKPETANAARKQSSFASRVRAALTEAEAKHADAVSPPQGNATPAPAPAALTNPARAAVVPTAPSAAAALSAPPAQEPLPSLPAPVEITSRPIVDLQAPPPVGRETGGLSALEQMLRHDPLQMRDDEVPRPPMPVGQ